MSNRVIVYRVRVQSILISTSLKKLQRVQKKLQRVQERLQRVQERL